MGRLSEEQAAQRQGRAGNQHLEGHAHERAMPRMWRRE